MGNMVVALSYRLPIGSNQLPPLISEIFSFKDVNPARLINVTAWSTHISILSLSCRKVAVSTCVLKSRLREIGNSMTDKIFQYDSQLVVHLVNSPLCLSIMLLWITDGPGLEFAKFPPNRITNLLTYNDSKIAFLFRQPRTWHEGEMRTWRDLVDTCRAVVKSAPKL